MSPLHLIWIIPLSACFGYAVAVLMMACKVRDRMRGERHV